MTTPYTLLDVITHLELVRVNKTSPYDVDGLVTALRRTASTDSEPEVILSIMDVTINEDRWSGMDGFAILTNKQKIHLLIDNRQSCCENWGYFMSEDDITKFLGATLLGVHITDTVLNSRDLNLGESGSFSYGGDTMFVNLETSAGLLQFVAYNEHNGYYGHSARVTSEQLNYETVL